MFILCHLYNKVSRGPKSHQPEYVPVLHVGESQGSITDCPGTKEGCCLLVGEDFGNGEGVIFRDSCIFCITPMGITAGGLKFLAQVVVPFDAVFALSAG